MSGYVFTLPEDKEQRQDVIANMVSEGRSLRNPHSTRWWIANLYTQGFREFSNIDYNSGTVSVAYLTESGVMKYRHDELVAKMMTQLGRLLSIDLSPRVTKKGVSLDGLRKSSVAQVVLDEAISKDKVERLKAELCPSLLMYGTVGVGPWFEADDSQGIEVIPPWELLPVPADATGMTGHRGLMRIRTVPVEWVKRLAITPGEKSKVYKNVESQKIPAGNMPMDLEKMGDGLTSLAGGGGSYFIQIPKAKDTANGKRRKEKDETQVPVTNLVEVWTETADGYLAEYSVYIGMTRYEELYRADHSQAKYPMPVRVIRDIPSGSFWGRSYVDLLIPLNNEVEYALSSMFEAIADFDLYGLQLWPTTLGEPTEAERGQDGLKRIRYEPDYTCPEIKPESVEPAKMTAPMVDAVKLATSLMDRVANQPTEMMAGGAPGRVDSSAGLGFLYEASAIPLSPTAKSMAMGVAGVYRSILRVLKDKWSGQKVVSISNLDDSLAGVIIDQETGGIQLADNAIPYPDEVEVTVASEMPVSKAQMAAELKESLTAGRITIDEYNQEVRKKALDLPVGDELGWQSYRRAMLENLMLFGDGVKPGKVIVSPYDVGRVHTTVLLTFMARPEFYAASAEVRDAFISHLEEHRANAGAYPDQMPYPEETAEGLLGEGAMMQGMPPQAM